MWIKDFVGDAGDRCLELLTPILVGYAEAQRRSSHREAAAGCGPEPAVALLPSAALAPDVLPCVALVGGPRHTVTADTYLAHVEEQLRAVTQGAVLQ